MSPNKIAERSCVREPGVTGKRQAIERSLSSLLSASATRVSDYNRNEAEVSRVPNRRYVLLDDLDEPQRRGARRQRHRAHRY